MLLLASFLVLAGYVIVRLLMNVAVFRGWGKVGEKQSFQVYT